MIVPILLIQKDFGIFNSWNNTAFVTLCWAFHGTVLEGFKRGNEQKRIFHLTQLCLLKEEKLNLCFCKSTHRSMLDIAAWMSHVEASKAQQAAILQMFLQRYSILQF